MRTNFISDVSASKDEILLQMLGKYRKNEEIYKSTIHKLQENNQNLMEEILHLKQLKMTNSPEKSKS